MQFHILAKWCERQSCHLEMLFSERNADDGDAEQQTEEDMTEPCPQTTEDNPEYVQRNADTTGGAACLLHLCTKRP